MAPGPLLGLPLELAWLSRVWKRWTVGDGEADHRGGATDRLVRRSSGRQGSRRQRAGADGCRGGRLHVERPGVGRLPGNVRRRRAHAPRQRPVFGEALPGALSKGRPMVVSVVDSAVVRRLQLDRARSERALVAVARVGAAYGFHTSLDGAQLAARPPFRAARAIGTPSATKPSHRSGRAAPSRSPTSASSSAASPISEAASEDGSNSGGRI